MIKTKPEFVKPEIGRQKLILNYIYKKLLFKIHYG